MFCFVVSAPKAGIVPKEALLDSSGKLAWTNTGKKGIVFGLVGTTEKFEYLSKSGEMGAVWDSLSHAGDEVVSVRYESRTYNAYHRVWELTVGGRGIRTYAETAAAWEAVNRFGRWFGPAAAAGVLFVGWVAWWRDPRRQPN